MEQSPTLVIRGWFHVDTIRQRDGQSVGSPGYSQSVGALKPPRGWARQALCRGASNPVISAERGHGSLFVLPVNHELAPRLFKRNIPGFNQTKPSYIPYLSESRGNVWNLRATRLRP